MLLRSISKALFACLRGRGLVLNLILKPLPIGTAKTILFCELTNQNCWYIFMTDDIWYLYSCCKYQRKTNREKRFKTAKSCSCLCRMRNYVFMDKFVVKTPVVSSTEKKSSHLPVNITAKERARKYPEGTFHVDDGLLFCSSCNVVIDYLRKSVVDRHLDSVSHKQNVEKNQRSKQKTLKTVLNCKTTAQVEKVKICQEWIRICTAANIPLHKSDNPLMRKTLILTCFTPIYKYAYT